jgi:hypothetical protein
MPAVLDVGALRHSALLQAGVTRLAWESFISLLAIIPEPIGKN